MFTESGKRPEGPEGLFVPLIMFEDGVMLCDPAALAAAPRPKQLRKAQPQGPFKILYKILIRWFG